MNGEYVKLEKTGEGVAILSLDNDHNLNALGVELAKEFDQALDQVAADSQARCLVIRGKGRAFSSGGNINQMRESLDGNSAEYMDSLTDAVYSAIGKVYEYEKPTVAAVHGAAYGAALNLAAACDIVIAAEGTRFCESFLRIGLIPGGMATVVLPAALGQKKAIELCLTAREFLADEARDLGLVSRVVAPDRLMDEALEVARRLAKAPPLALREAKKLLREAPRRPLAEQVALERKTQIKMAGTSDFREGITAFLEKRKPRFTGE